MRILLVGEHTDCVLSRRDRRHPATPMRVVETVLFIAGGGKVSIGDYLRHTPQELD